MTRMYSMKHGSKRQSDAGFLAYWKDELEKLSSEHILNWAVDSYSPRLVLKTAFEPEGCVILSMLSKIVPKVSVLCNEIDFQMQRFLGVSKCFYMKTGLEITPIYLHEMNNSRDLSFDAVLCGIRREGRPGIGVMGMDYFAELPSIAPLVRWTREAVMNKLRRDSILDSSFINIWRADR